MNAQQSLWWNQVRSDYQVLLLLRKNDVEPCHQLHYLQMVTEKLGKAYFWRGGHPPPRSHVSFVKFLQAIDDRKKSDRSRIPALFGFGAAAFEGCIRAITPVAYDLERLAPSLAGEGPNPEYPWPSSLPIYAPSSYKFKVWLKLVESVPGRRLLQVIDVAVREFPKFA